MEWSSNAEIVKGEKIIISLLREMIENQEKMIKLLEKEKRDVADGERKNAE